MKIYTKTGDQGTTALYGGKRISKGDWRIESYGTVDELNAHIGMVMSFLKEEDDIQRMVDIQSRLFDLGTHLAAEPGKKNLILPELNEEHVIWIEKCIDIMNEDLEELKYFILPSGSSAVAQCHIARTVCRRAERCVVRLAETESVLPILAKYLNRLSDFLFVLARKMAKDSNVTEVIWKAH